ncbi:MAG: hypothetical protein ACE5JM_07435 [Armatimonadota bacterium]
MVHGRPVAAAVVLAILHSLPATAQNVTLDLEGVPLSQAIERLSLRGGVEVRMDDVPHELLDRPVTYRSQDVPTRRALREICQELGLRMEAYRAAGQGVLFKLIPLRPGELQPPAVQAGPYIVRLLSIRRRESASLSLGRPTEPPTLRRSLTLSFEVEVDTHADAKALLAVHPAADVTDNTGKALEPSSRELSSGTPRGGGYMWPRPMTPALAFGLPATDAVSLREIAGELVIAGKVTPVRLEFQATQTGARLEKEGYAVTLESVKLVPPRICHVELTIVQPPRPPDVPEPRWREQLAGTCTVVLDDGSERYARQGGGLVTPGAAGADKWELSFRAYDIPAGAAPVKVAYSLTLRSHERKRIPFSFQDIPLPTWGD